MGAGQRPSTVSAVITRYGPGVETEFRPRCRSLEIAYPPRRIQLLAFKRERMLEVWGANARGPYGRLAAYPILAASGRTGPKLKEGDRQVPEGFYRITHLNPMSQYHLSLKVDYPNREDIANSRLRRDQMGGDIYVHGKNVSIGCIAIGDAAIEKVFCLVAQARPADRRIIIAPHDFRKDEVVPSGTGWVGNLYRRMDSELSLFPPDGRQGS